MKRLLVLLITSILAVCLIVGCRGEVEVYVETEDTINTRVGQEFVIALDSNPTTGYDWEESHDSAVLCLVESRYTPDEEKPGLVGAGGTQYYRFRGLKAGTTEITVVYKRAWETEIAEQKVFKVDIE